LEEKMKAAQASHQIVLRNILFATDFSPTADSAFHFAVNLARQYGARLFALHVRSTDVYAFAPPENWRDISETGDLIAHERIKLLLEVHPDIRSEIRVGVGNVWSEMERVIEKDHIDLIVLGTHGRTGVGKLLLGSVAEEIIRRSPCPVLTIGPLAARPGNDGKLAEILFATDFSPASQAAAPYALSLAQENEAGLTVLHVLEKTKLAPANDPAQLAAATERVLENLIPDDAKAWCQPHCVVAFGKPAEQIVEVANDHCADLIVLGVRRPTGVPGSSTHLPFATAHKLLAQARCPVLTVRA
jgi:nucleotide-binding universal stress UspA family protein